MYLRSEPPWFGFLIHPRDVDDLIRWKGSRLLREYSASDDEFVAKATTIEPVVAGEVLFGMGRPVGELVGVMRMPYQVMGSGGRDAVTEAMRFAVDRGAPVIGLGALTAPATAAGRGLVKSLPAGFTLTTGNAYTAAVVRENVRAAAAAMALERPARVAVVGATGSVGVPTSHLLVGDGYEVTVIGRSLGRVRATIGGLANDAAFADNLAPLLKADIVVVLTSEAAALLRPGDVRAGAAVIDVTQPANIPETSYQDFQARGIRVVPGGLVRIPGYRCTFDFALPVPGAAFACLAETYLMAKEGLREHSVGPPPLEVVHRIAQVARRHGVTPVELDFSHPAEKRKENLP